MKTLNQFKTEFDKSPAGIERADNIERHREHRSGLRRERTIPTGEKITFGVCSCTHFGSLYANIDGLRAFYDEAKRQGARFVLHAGDVLDGYKMHKGQEFEQSAIGWEAQAQVFCNEAPNTLPTYFITGNHDESLKKLAGMRPGEELARRRPDWTYLGPCSGRIALEAGGGRKCTVDLIHPAGGASYALSYRSQKLVEALEGGSKPDILLIGHYHKAEFLPSYRNVCVIQAGTFQWQTQFMRELALAAHVGGWIITVNLGKGANIFGGQFVAFYR
jgi:predicted phosphodiesterase